MARQVTGSILTGKIFNTRVLASMVVLIVLGLYIHEYLDVYVFNITDIGDIYKRLLNHRPVIQNEVYYFVREFEVSIGYWMAKSG